ncbi:MAG: ECF transporter S component [Candidatus Lokiarchaeota archaeon]|nr:ECF transporter S component [Candidatus Lokiarchaeota archaeon]
MMSEKTFETTRTSFFGYSLPNNALVLSLIGIFTAFNFLMTFFVQIPVPATGGYINIGDVAVMYVALLFGPIIGGIAGGLGPMLADIAFGYAIYAPATLIIKAIEGFVIGIVANPGKNDKRLSAFDVIAVVLGGLCIPFGYFIYESLLYGAPTALVEMPGNFIQFVVAATASILLISASRKNIIKGLPQVFDKIFLKASP